MQTSSQIRSLLRSGDRRTIGNVPEVVELVTQNKRLLPALIHCLFDEKAAIRMRAADAVEKVSRTPHHNLDRYTALLLDLFEATEQPELLWHLAVILPRLPLSSSQRVRTAEALQICLKTSNSIVKTFALQGLADLTSREPSLKPLTLDLLREAERSGTPAMKARSRKLLMSLQRS